MFDDAQQFWDEFDMSVILNPQGPEQFAFSLIMVLIFGVCGFIALRLVLNLLE